METENNKKLCYYISRVRNQNKSGPARLFYLSRDVSAPLHLRWSWVLQRLQARTQESPGPEVCSDCSVRGAGRGCAAAVCSLTARDKYAAPPLLRPVCPRHPSPPCCCCCSPPPSSPRPPPPRSTPTPRPRTERKRAAWTRPSAASPRSSGTPMCTL